ncbi:TonB-dependent receptor [Sphingobium estronivorans]|uniref:TonB-dependent receptor n=1 Tax=Sphingobium estronivorans TaxID=1577690 RepID=UPI0012386254|nr:TonB-dependent receptor [Sphingobium estronivorans]
MLKVYPAAGFGKSRIGLVAGTAMSLLLVPGAAIAQDDSTDIVVTAQRRSERLQDVPIAITALSAETLTNRGTVNIGGVAQITPSLNVVAYPNSSDTVSLTMRGQGMADAGQITKDGGVGLYVDGFYIARPQAALFDLGAPERIEVLRGPQGTLYGRNTTGGAINIITTKPKGEWGGNTSLTFGSRNYVRGLASVDLPEIGNFAIKGTILYTNKDGWVKNPGAQHDYHESGQLAGRVAVRWTPSTDVTVDYVWDRGRVESTMPYFSNPALDGTIPGYVADRDRTYAPIDIGRSKALFVDHQLTAEWAASDTVTIRSLSSYRGFEAKQFVNYGLGQSSPFYPVSFEQFHRYRTKQYTQEVQLIGSIGDRVEYTGGLYYFRETGRHFIDGSLGLLAVPVIIPSTRDVTTKSISKAAYLQATITPPVLDDRMKLTLGGRYTEDQRNATRNSTSFGFPVDVDVTNDRKFTNFSPSANLSMQWTPAIMTYAKVSKGYKAGGSSEGGPDFTATYAPEKVTTYELGLKSQFFDRLVTLNAALFYNKFKDLQVDFVADAVDTSIVSTVNAGSAEVKGLEAEIILQPSVDFNIRAAYTYLDPKMKRITAPAGTNFDPAVNPASPFQVGDDVTGYFTLPFVPKNALSVSADWTFLRSGDAEFSMHGSYNYQQAMYTSSAAGAMVVGRNFYRNDSTNITNARITWKQPVSVGDFSLSVFADNLFDERHRDFVIGVGGSSLTGFTSTTAPWSEPRTIGVEARVSF